MRPPDVEALGVMKPLGPLGPGAISPLLAALALYAVR